MAVAAACTAIYITRFANGKPSSKLASLKKTRSVATSSALGACVPLAILKKLDKCIEELKEEAKQEEEEAGSSADKKPSGAKRKRPACT